MKMAAATTNSAKANTGDPTMYQAINIPLGSKH